MNRKLLILALTFVLCVAGLVPVPASASADSGPLFSLTGSTAGLNVGDEVTFTVKGEQLQDVYAFEINVGFDPGKLQFKSATSDIAGFSFATVVQGNQVQFAHTLTGQVPGYTGSYTLGNLKFQVLDRDTGEVALRKITLVNSQQASNEYADRSAPVWTGGSVTASGSWTRELALSWSSAGDNTAVTGYKVFMGGSLLAVLGNVTSYQVTGLTPNTSYTFKIEARDAAGNWSSNGPSAVLSTAKDDKDSSGSAPAPNPEKSTAAEPQSGSSAAAGTGTAPSTGSLTPAASLNPSTGSAKAEVSAAGLSDALSKAATDASGVKTVTVDIPKVDGAKGYEAVLPRAAVGQLTASEKVAINTDTAKLTVPGSMLSALPPGSNVALAVAPVDKATLDPQTREAVGDRPIIELNFKIDGQVTSWSNPAAPVSVSIPYKPTAAELANPEHIVVYYIDEAGKATAVPSGKYDPATGQVTFTVTHFSKYAVSYVEKSFEDLGAAGWAKKEIEVLASKGVIQGTSDNTFTPAAAITRADFLQLLVNSLGLSAVVGDNFSDVQKSDYYYEALGIAKKLGVTDGRDGSRFDPSALISRQEMMTLTARALKLAGKLPASGDASELAAFSDRASVAAYAADSIAALVKAGLVQGSGGSLNPLGSATRAETAVLMYRVYNQ